MTEESNIEQNEGVNSNKRQRISKACDACRRKKSKCNGEIPCRGCSSAEVCTYSAHKERRKRKAASKVDPPVNDSDPTTTTADEPTPGSGIANAVSSATRKTIQGLNSRIASLESLLFTLVEKMEVPQTNETGSDSDSPTSSTSTETSPEEATTPPNDLTTVSSSKNAFTRFTGIAGRKMAKAPPAKAKCHSLLCIITENSLQWIKSKLRFRDISLFWSLERLPLAFNATMLSSVRSWIDTPSKSRGGASIRHKKELTQYGDFPLDSKLVFGLLSSYYSRISDANILCHVDFIRELFDRYYESEKESSIRRKFKYSELLIMNISLAMALENKGDEWNKATELYSDVELKNFQQVWFESSVYYYDKVNVVSEGLITVQAILLLSCYSNAHYATDIQVNNMLTSVAIRFAQELGLNRLELIESLHSEQAELCRGIWWYCHFMDLDTCYKTGKPLLINLDDVSTLTEFDTGCPYSVPSDPIFTREYFNQNLSQTLVSLSMDSPHVYYHHYMLLLNRIRAKSYNELFSAKARRTLMNSLDMQVSVISRINEEMMILADSMDPLFRPMLYPMQVSEPSSPEFISFYRKHEQYLSEVRLIFQMTFFSHLMIINRVPYLANFPNMEENSSYSSLAFVGARALLNSLLASVDENISKFVGNTIQAYAFIAFLILLTQYLNSKTSPHLVEDFNLLARVSMEVFSKGCASKTKEDWERERIVNAKNVMAVLSARVMLKIMVGVTESELGLDLIQGNSKLQIHLDSCELIYPELFENLGNNEVPDFFNGVLFSQKQSVSSTEGKVGTVDSESNFGSTEQSDVGHQTMPQSPFNFSVPSPMPSSRPSTDPFSRSLSQFSQEQEINDVQLADFNDDAISNLLYSQAYGFTSVLFDGLNQSN
ncbi:hypothetical protein CAAN1_03S05908 [[Candida] anglica]|uniref:Zn(2)-C6 fungal-type domain-containing protein n=1 Tax=[Candida] anglica TaxID=148631 RepID=A0ABP0EKR6_9ASCO